MLKKLDNRFSYSEVEVKNFLDELYQAYEDGVIKDADIDMQLEKFVDAIKEYLGNEILYKERINSIFIKLHLSIPNEVKEECNVCRMDRNLSDEIICRKYFEEAYDEIVAKVVPYVGYVENNRHTFNSKDLLLSATNEFFEHFEAKNGKLDFYADKFDKIMLTNSLMILRESLLEMDTRTAMQRVIEIIEELESHKVIAQSTDRVLYNHVKPQIKFLKKQLKYYEKKLLTESLNDRSDEKPKIEDVLESNKNIIDPKSVLTGSNVFCASMPIDIPIEHFKILTISKSKNGKPYLTQGEFEIFIQRAFLGVENLEKLKFNQEPKGEKLKIQYLFRQFYENYCFEYFDTGQTQDFFIKLLTENFTGWNFKNVKNNFKTKPKSLI
ncbi:hypothetical protein [Bizionia sp. M204]|uniref:hypothetical protein n=1 Tax=Bizionia sp. M204 TaxID=2675331 RepID=UPI0020642A16|nr:hypothetical protein [Bizionia sp. M204]UPS90461.1 hypothetical protein GMA17_01435 [Bizionia sp. M204]